MNIRTEYIEAFATILSAILATILAGVFAILKVIVEHNLQKKTSQKEVKQHEVINSWDSPQKEKKNIRKTIWFILVFMLLGSFTGYLIGSNIVGKAGALAGSFSVPRVLSSPFGPTPTLIPTGNLLMEINFASNGEGDCNDYDKSKLGYEDKRYYIYPGASGFVSVCHADDHLLPQGSLQIKAYPGADSTNFGYGVLFGWKRGELGATKDACIFGIQRNGSQTEAVFVDWVDGQYDLTRQEISSITLDSQPHTLQVTLKADRLAQGTLDGRFFAEHQFSQCGQGPIGMVAWGIADKKIYFDDLKLYSLP